jgi:hypothetical protein
MFARVCLTRSSDIVWHIQDLVARDEPISEQLSEEAAKLKDIVLTEVCLLERRNLVPLS